MDLITVFLVAVGLSFDSFAVSVSSGIAKAGIRFLTACRIAISFAFFQSLMPLLGWLLGIQIEDYVRSVDHWIAFGLLGILGGKMIYEGSKTNGGKVDFDPLKPVTLIGLSIATSIDAFIVGIGFGFLKINIWAALAVIGAVTYIASMLGILFGKKIGWKAGRKSEIIGGIVLIGIGIRILVQHIWF